MDSHPEMLAVDTEKQLTLMDTLSMEQHHSLELMVESLNKEKL